MHVTKNITPKYSVFKEYDIRGKFGVDILLEDFGYIASRAIHFLKSPGDFIGKKQVSQKKINKSLAELYNLEIVDRNTNKSIEKSPKQYTAIIARDYRPSSQQIHDCMIVALRRSGINIIDLGKAPVFLMNFALLELKADIGFMITASHNAISDNGLKITLGTKPIGGIDLLGLRSFPVYCHDKFGKYHQKCLEQSYIEFLLKDIKITNSTRIQSRIIWDCGNGTTGLLLARLLQHLPQINSIIINDIESEDNRASPNPADPNRIKQLQQLVVEHSASMAIAFDEDGDRLVVVDELGHIRKSEELVMLWAREIANKYCYENNNTEHEGLCNNPNTPPIIIGDVYTSQVAHRYITGLGLQFIFSKVGHSNIKRNIQNTGAALAGEISGHFYFADRYFGYDDAIYAALRLLEITMDAKLSDALSNIPKVFAIQKIILQCNNSNKKTLMKFIKNIIELECNAWKPSLEAKYYDFGGFDSINEAANDKIYHNHSLHFAEDDEQIETWPKISYLDGIRVDYPDCWFVIRPSNTENYISAIGGGDSTAICTELEIYLAQLLGITDAGAK